ncbi:MAG TPA: patatin-like phospholipase family protein [Terriglobales bacterium]|nr:patatin-like phospholipase family protein [Terriglobales bacterium]
MQNQDASAWDALPYLYLLRVQIITFLALLSFPFLALWFAPNLLRGVFDVTPMGIVFVTLGAALAGWTVMVTAWQVFLYGPERFHIREFPFRSSMFKELPTRVGHSPVFALFSLPVILTAMYVSKNGGTSTYLRLLLGALGGAVLAFVILVAGGQFQRRGWSEAKPVTAFLSFFGPGFKKDGNSAQEGHYLALWSFLLSFMVYVAIGIGKFFRIGDPATVPTLADLLVFLMILCWGLSAVTFILDRFRIPLLLPFLLAAIVSAHVHATDHYFYMFGTKSTPDLSPAQVIRAGKPGSAVIVVAASGGGIKAAAWTGRVLTGLEENNPRIFGDSVRLISAVSGGSVGAMYFVSEYDANGTGLPSNPKDLEEAVARSEASSLDDIAWGLVYPDFLRIFVPVFEHLDRGRALEAALTRELPNRKDHLFSPLSDWREGVLEGWRPAVVFNATVVESGERFLLGTTDLSAAPGRTSLRDTKEFPQFAGRDISLVTAARLSATFPYVSPAARPDIAGKQIHAVDGGYTDNYGMATLLAWLDEALRASGNPVRRVLIIEIRASAPTTEPPALSWRGWSFQSYAPISAMLNVRDTGQLPRNQEELDILRRFAASCNIDIEDAVFEYPPEDAPLSWHLSPNDQKEIEKFWVSSKTDKPKQTVRAFLAAPPPPPVTTPPPSACQ